MSPSKRPSPERQIMLKYSHLHGMERPVRSFRSFVRAIPPRASPDKPLPPRPTRPPLRTTSSSSSLATAQSRSTRLSLWESPPSWDNTDRCQNQPTPPFVLREYSPLIPEPPEDIAAMQSNPVLWQQDHGPFQQTPLDPIHERNAATPEVPPRNPSRLSLSLSNPATTRKNSKETLPSVTSRYSTGMLDDELSTEGVNLGFFNEGLPSPLDLFHALTDMSMNERAFPTGLASSRDQGILWNRDHRRSDSTQLEAEVPLDLQDNRHKMFEGTAHPEHSPGTSENMEVSDKLQGLIFAQDYHNNLADANPNEHARPWRDANAGTPHRDPDLTPEPLTWRKESTSVPSSETPQRPQLPPAFSSGRHRNLRMMSSWVNHHLKRDQQTGLQQRSVSDPGSTPQMHESYVYQHSKNDARLANIVQHSKDFVSRKILRRETEPASPMLISLPIPQSSAQVDVSSTVSIPSSELAKPVLRLPGGLALIRQSPPSTLRPQTANDSPAVPFSELSCANFPIPSPLRHNFSRRGSVQCTQSQPHFDSPSAIPRQVVPRPALSATLQSFSYSTTSLPTPPPQMSPQPATPVYNAPQTRRRSHNIGSPLSAQPPSHGVGRRTHDSLDNVIHKLNLFDKAKHAHGAWKKHHKEAKNEKLKQSIRMVGPADARDVAGYINCAVDGRLSEDSGVGEGKLDGCVNRGAN